MCKLKTDRTGHGQTADHSQSPVMHSGGDFFPISGGLSIVGRACNEGGGNGGASRVGSLYFAEHWTVGCSTSERIHWLHDLSSVEGLHHTAQVTADFVIRQIAMVVWPCHQTIPWQKNKECLRLDPTWREEKAWTTKKDLTQDNQKGYCHHETTYDGNKHLALDRQPWEKWVVSCATRHRRV